MTPNGTTHLAACRCNLLRAFNHETVSPPVQMLIDTKRDMTLLPRRAVEAMGIKAIENATYELINFDGVRSSLRPLNWI